MKLLLASASLDEFRWAGELHLTDGAYVTPEALDHDAFGIPAAERVAEVARLTDGPLLAVVGALAADDLHAEGRALARVGDQVVVGVPFVEDGIAALRRLASEGIRTAAAFVVTPAQAWLAAKAGAAWVCVGAEQLEAQGTDSEAVLREIRNTFDRHGLECEVVAVATEAPRVASAALAAGADAVAVTPAALRALVHHPVTDRALDHMLGTVSRRPHAARPR